MAFSAAELAAITRLGDYNGSRYDAVSNLYGLGGIGYQTNGPAAWNDTATVATAVARETAAAAVSAAAALASEGDADTAKTAAEAAQTAAEAAQAAAEAAAASGVRHCTVGGTGDAILLTATPTISAYAAPLALEFIATADSTGAVQVNVNTLGLVDLTDSAGDALTATNKLTAGTQYVIYYDGTGFRLAGGSGAASGGSNIAFTWALSAY